MKTTYLFSALGIAFFFSCTEVEQDHTPEGVLESFSTMYPNTQDVKWEHEKDVWEAEFMKDNHEVSAEFSETGGWIETDTKLMRSEVPAAVVFGIQKKYSNAEFLKFEEVRGKDFLAYEVDIRFEGKEIEILISGSGDILDGEKQTDSKEDSEEEGQS